MWQYLAGVELRGRCRVLLSKELEELAHIGRLAASKAHASLLNRGRPPTALLVATLS